MRFGPLRALIGFVEPGQHVEGAPRVAVAEHKLGQQIDGRVPPRDGLEGDRHSSLGRRFLQRQEQVAVGPLAELLDELLLELIDLALLRRVGPGVLGGDRPQADRGTQDR